MTEADSTVFELDNGWGVYTDSKCIMYAQHVNSANRDYDTLSLQTDRQTVESILANREPVLAGIPA